MDNYFLKGAGFALAGLVGFKVLGGRGFNSFSNPLTSSDDAKELAWMIKHHFGRKYKTVTIGMVKKDLDELEEKFGDKSWIFNKKISDTLIRDAVDYYNSKLNRKKNPSSDQLSSQNVKSLLAEFKKMQIEEYGYEQEKFSHKRLMNAIKNDDKDEIDELFSILSEFQGTYSTKNEKTLSALEELMP